MFCDVTTCSCDDADNKHDADASLLHKHQHGDEEICVRQNNSQQVCALCLALASAFQVYVLTED